MSNFNPNKTMSLWMHKTTRPVRVQAGARRGAVTRLPLTYVKSKTVLRAAECGVFLLGAAPMDLESTGNSALPVVRIHWSLDEISDWWQTCCFFPSQPCTSGRNEPCQIRESVKCELNRTERWRTAAIDWSNWAWPKPWILHMTTSGRKK